MFGVVLVFPLLCSLVGWVYMPVFHNLQLVSSYEYLELRFNYSVKMMCSGVYTISMMLYLSIVVYTPALALQTVVGLNVDVSCACIFLVCVFYTSVSSLIFGTDSITIVHGRHIVRPCQSAGELQLKKGKLESTLCAYFVILPSHHSLSYNRI